MVQLLTTGGVAEFRETPTALSGSVEMPGLGVWPERLIEDLVHRPGACGGERRERQPGLCAGVFARQRIACSQGLGDQTAERVTLFEKLSNLPPLGPDCQPPTVPRLASSRAVSV